MLVIGLVVLGPKRLPDAGRALGDGIRGFKGALSGPDRDETPRAVEAAPPATGLASTRTESHSG